MFDTLNDDNVMLYAMKAYERPNMLISEFDEDLKRFNYLKRLFYRHKQHNEIRERLVINHLIIIFNVFGQEVGSRLLFYFIEDEHYSILKTYLTFLNRMPKVITGIRDKIITTDDISFDLELIEILKRIR